MAQFVKLDAVQDYELHLQHMLKTVKSPLKEQLFEVAMISFNDGIRFGQNRLEVEVHG